MQNVIAPELIFKTAPSDRSVRGMPVSQSENGGQLKPDAHIPLAHAKAPDFTQIVEGLQRNTTPPATAAIPGFRHEIASPDQPEQVQPIRLIAKDAVRFTSVVQPELSDDLLREAPLAEGADAKYPEEPDAPDLGAPPDNPPSRLASAPIQHSGATGPGWFTTEAGSLSQEPLPEALRQRSVPVLGESQPGNILPPDTIITEPGGQHVEAAVISGPPPATQSVSGNRELTPGPRAKVPEIPYKPDLNKTAGPPSTPQASDIAAENSTPPPHKEQQILLPDSQNYRAASIPAGPSSSTPETKASLPPGSAPQMPPLQEVRAHPDIAGIAATPPLIAGVAAKTIQASEPHAEMHAATMPGNGVETKALPGKADNQAAIIPGRQKARADSISRSHLDTKPDTATVLREGHQAFAATRNGPPEVLAERTEKAPENNQKTTLPTTQSTNYRSNDLTASDSRPTHRDGGAPVLSHLVPADATDSNLQDKPAPPLPPGITVPGASTVAQATPVPPPSATAADQMTFARISSQLAGVAAQNPDAPIELTLSPEELGRVRMNFATLDGALNVTIAAERPETLSLLRRHIDVLMQDFRDLGYSDVNLGFEDNPAQQNTPEQIPGEPSADQLTTEAGTNTETPRVLLDLSALPDGGIDIRL